MTLTLSALRNLIPVGILIFNRGRTLVYRLDNFILPRSTFAIDKIRQARIQYHGLNFVPRGVVAGMLESCVVELYAPALHLNFDDHRGHFLRVEVDVAVVVHLVDCIDVVGATGDCVVVAYSLVDNVHNSRYCVQVAEAADNIGAVAVDNIVEVV